LNTRDLQAYLRRVAAGKSPTFQSEMLPAEERARETLAVQLRRAAGIQRARFRQQTGFALDDLVGAEVKRLQELGLLVDDEESVCLTRRGKHVADAVIERLL
jgi:oxygen-independent coproporphyrinogen-3 oxidase